MRSKLARSCAPSTSSAGYRLTRPACGATIRTSATPARWSTACGSRRSVISVPSFKASTATTGRPGARGFRASTKACLSRPIVAASSSCAGACGAPAPQPTSPRAAILAPINARTHIHMAALQVTAIS